MSGPHLRFSRRSSSATSNPAKILSNNSPGAIARSGRAGSASSRSRRSSSSVGNAHHASNVVHSESFSSADPAKLTDAEMDCLKEAFALFDADHDGEISVGELGRVMRNHGLAPSESELAAMIGNVDKNANGAIDFNEFIEMMLRRDHSKDEDVLQAFRVFDRDGDGLISEEELRLTMNNLGEPLTDAELRCMMEEADLDGDGRINFKEFARLMEAQQVLSSPSGPIGPGSSSGKAVGNGSNSSKGANNRRQR